MHFDYDSNTRNAYRSDNVAKAYNDAFTKDRSIYGWRFRAVAAREVSQVRCLLKRVSHSTVVDIPAGTGKLAPMFAKLGAYVIACDISESMLALAKEAYMMLDYQDVEFKVCDATRIDEAVHRKVDAVVCLRLMHRVPSPVREEILNAIGNVADHAVISYGIESTYHRFRRRIRSSIFGGGIDSLCFESVEAVRTELSRRFEVLGEVAVIPLLSQERLFLVRAL